MLTATGSITVLLPIYNEEENLENLFVELERTLQPLGRPFEVLAIDDGSRDRSPQILEKLAREKPYLKVILFRRNAGQTAAFDAGFRNATGEIIITMDSDLQNDPADIPKMLAFFDQGYDFVTGWRRNRQDGFILRTFPSKIANWIIRKVTGTKIHDLGCSLKLYRRELTDELRIYGEMHRFIGVMLEQMGARVAEIEVHHRPRVAGVSKYNLSRTFKVLLDLVTVWFMQGYRTKPSYLFGGCGMAMLATSAVLNVVVLYEKFGNGVYVHRNPLFLIAIFLAVVAVQFIALGLMAELMIRTYFESSSRTPYIIAKKLGFDRRASA